MPGTGPGKKQGNSTAVLEESGKNHTKGGMAVEKERLVSDKTCKGCMYYSYLNAGNKHSGRCCYYTYLTGKIRQNKPSKCEVKKLGERPRASIDTGYLSPRALKGGGWHG